jgi:hypothetical protein
MAGKGSGNPSTGQSLSSLPPSLSPSLPHRDSPCSEKSYIPTSLDVGRVLRIECRAMSPDGVVLSGLLLSQSLIVSPLLGPVVVYTESVLAAPRLPPRRALQAVPGAASSSQSQFRFRLVSYNILAEIYATKHVSPSSHRPLLTRPGLSLQRPMEPHLALSSIDHPARASRHTRGHLLPPGGAGGPFLPEPCPDSLRPWLRGSVQAEDQGVHGPVRQGRWLCPLLEEIQVLSRGELFDGVQRDRQEERRPARSRRGRQAQVQSLAVPPSMPHTPSLGRYISRLSKDNVAQIVILEALARLPQPQSQRSRSSNRLCVVNTHLYSNHTRPAIKLWQTITLLKEIEPFILSQDMALVVCGDFNSEPESAVYQYLSHGAVDDQSGHLLEEVAKVRPLSLARAPLTASTEFGRCRQPQSRHRVRVSDAARLRHGAGVHQLHEELQGHPGLHLVPPPSLCLSLMPGRYTPSRLKMLAVSTPPTAEDVASHCEGLPSVQYPSDHIYLCCDASLNLNGGGGGNNGGGGMSLSAMALRHQLGHKPGLGNPRMAQQQSGRR